MSEDIHVTRMNVSDDILGQLRRWISLMQQVHEAKHYIQRTEQLAHPHLMQTFDEIWGVLLAFRGANHFIREVFREGRLREDKTRSEGSLREDAKPGRQASQNNEPEE